MSKERKGACPTVGAVEQAMEPGQASRQAHDSKTNFTTASADRQWKIADILPVSKSEEGTDG